MPAISVRPETFAAMELGVPAAPTDGAVCSPLAHKGKRGEGVICAAAQSRNAYLGHSHFYMPARDKPGLSLDGRVGVIVR